MSTSAAPMTPKIPVVALGVVALVYVLYAWDRLVVPIELVDLRKAYGFSLSAAGLLGSVFTLGLALTAIPAGFVAMRFGTRATLIAGAAVFSVCIAYPAIGFSAPDLVAVQIVSGAGEGLYNVALYSFLGTLTDRYRGAATGLAASLFGFGVFLAPLVVSGIVGATGNWRSPFYLFAAAGLVGAFGIGLSLRKGTFDAGEPRSPVTLSRLVDILAPRNLAVCGVMIVTGLAIYSFLGVYETYLRTAAGMSFATASAVFSMSGIGSIAGGTPLGYVADIVGRKRYLIGACIVSGLAGIATLAAPPVPVLLGALCFVFGAATNSIYANCYALIQDQVRREEIPLATGVLATIYFLMAAFSGFLLITAERFLGWGEAGLVIYGVPYAIATAIVMGLIRSERISRAGIAGSP